MWHLARILVYCVLVGLIECDTNARIYIPCLRTDSVCQTVSAQLTYQNIIRGVPSLGIETSEPLYHKEISGIIEDKFFYNFTDVLTTGTSGCVINLFKLDINLANLKLNLTCAAAVVTAKYNVSGEYLGRKVNEASNFTTLLSSYILGVDLKLNQVQGDDGKKHLLIVDINPYASAAGPILIKLENSPDFERFLNEHQQENKQFIGNTVVNANLKVLVARANIFLKSVAIDDLFLRVGVNL
ncbi:hypothetical protein NE865_00552 [Phthorimaea operculella]|nr:hypothetical protein NE865_00552 [Phthorimaea operculella]